MRRQLVLSLFSAVLLTTQLAALPSSGEKEAKEPSESKSVETRLRLGGIHLGAGFLFASGCPYPGWYGPGYDPFWYDAFFFPVYRTRTGHAQVGRVKLKNIERDAEVYIDEGYAGPGSELKSFYLDPGSYRLSVRQGQRSPFEMKLYILSGKTLEIDVSPNVGGQP